MAAPPRASTCLAHPVSRRDRRSRDRRSRDRRSRDRRGRGRRNLGRRGVAALLVVALLGGAAAATVPAARAARAARGDALATPSVPSLTKLLGQRLMVGVSGTTASPSFLGRVRRGEIGAVILFAFNIVSTQQVRALTTSLQTAARQGGNPSLLIAVDQEGGEVKRFGNAPPSLSPPQIVATGKVSESTAQGKATGAFLKSVGIDVDLAPVADVPSSTSSFIWQQGRAFSFRAPVVAQYATAFATGLQSTGVAAAAKHFPGLGTSTVTTDVSAQKLYPSAAQRAAALLPYQSLIPSGVDMVLVTVAGFPYWDPSGAPAALSSRIMGTLLRGQLHFRGVTVTDSLEASTGHDPVTAGVLSARAGADLLLYTRPATGVLPALIGAANVGKITKASELASYNRIVALKRRLVAAP